jgi:translocation and assembly module TamB
MKILLLKIFYRSLSLLMVVILALAGLSYYLLNSESGARLVLNRADAYLAENFSFYFNYESVSGTLVEGLSFSGLELANSQFNLQTQTFNSSWSLWALFNKEIRLQTLRLDNLVLRQTETTGNIESAENTQTQERDIVENLESLFDLPFSVRINSFELLEPEFLFAQQTLAFDRFSGSISLDSENLSINELNIETSSYSLDTSFGLQADNFLIDGNLDWTLNNTATQAIAADGFSGALFFSGDVNSLEISHELLQPVQMESSGSLTTGLIDETGLNFSFEHNLQNLTALTPLPSLLSSVTGSLLTHGSPELIFLDADLNLQSGQFLPINLSLSGEYENTVLNFETISVDSPEINLVAVAELATQPFAFEVDWQLNDLQLNNYLDAFVLTDVNGGGSFYTDAAGNSALNLSFLDANLNNYTLTTTGGINFNNNALSDIDLLINTNNNRLNLNGSITETLAVDWLIDAPDLAVWLPALNGEVQGSGDISGDIDNPVISGSLQADNLNYQADDTRIHLENLRADILTRQENYQFNFSANNLFADIAGNELEATETQLDLNGNLFEHRGELSLLGEDIEFELAFNGAYVNNNWQADIQTGIVDAGYGRWQLQNTMGLILAPEAINISQHCWSYLDTEFCLNGSILAQNFTFNANINNFPLAYLNTTEIVTQIDNADLSQVFSDKPDKLTALQNNSGFYLPPNTFMQGMLAAQLSAAGNTAAFQQADFTLDLQTEALELNLFLTQEDDNQSVQPDIRTFAISTDDLRFTRDNNVLASNIDLSVYHLESTGLDVQGDLSFIASMDAAKNLEGDLQLNFSSLDWLEALLPDVRNTRGELSGGLQLSGTFDQPKFVSNLQLQDGRFEMPEYGISPEQITIDFSSNADQELLINARAISGDGALELTGNTASLYNNRRNFQLVLQGENFTLINNPGTKMLVSPDIRLSYEADILDLQGVVVVPEMELDIRENTTVLLNEGTNISRDVVIVNAPPEQAALVENRRHGNIREIPVTADLELILGDNVHFQGLGLDLMLNGELQAQQELNRPLLTYGDISITQGSYEIYGQSLDVTNGKLIFFGNLANPALDVRAYRQGSNVQAGIQINGTLLNMQSQLFSTPTLPDSEILSILITGKSFNDTNSVDQNNLLGAITSLGINRGQGGITDTIRNQLGLDALALNSQADLQQSSLGLGKYLTPNIFMNYEIGLYEKESILSLDYILNDRLRLEVESGISQSIDMTFRIEK